MIRFSRMADYGILLLGHFARHESVLVNTRDLADLYHMPRTVVANLLKEFSKAGLLQSRRGLHGGYMLARPAAEISLLDVLNVIDGPVQLIDCAVDDQSVGNCGYEDVCPSRSPMRSVHRRIIELLENVSLAELMQPQAPPVPLGK